MGAPLGATQASTQPHLLLKGSPRGSSHVGKKDGADLRELNYMRPPPSAPSISRESASVNSSSLAFIDHFLFRRTRPSWWRLSPFTVLHLTSAHCGSVPSSGSATHHFLLARAGSGKRQSHRSAGYTWTSSTKCLKVGRVEGIGVRVATGGFLDHRRT